MTDPTTAHPTSDALVDRLGNQRFRHGISRGVQAASPLFAPADAAILQASQAISIKGRHVLARQPLLAGRILMARLSG